MDHREAVRSQIAEKYLLGDLQVDEREQFEDHLFDCPECADAVRTGVLFMDNAAAELPQLAVSEADSKAASAAPRHGVRPRNWWANVWENGWAVNWRQPAFAAPVLALVAMTGLWVTDHARLAGALANATAPQAFAEESLDVRRGAIPVIASQGGNYYAGAFNINQDTLPAYTVEISGNGVPSATFSMPSRHGGRYHLLFPKTRYKPGVYQIAVKSGPEKSDRILENFALSIE